MVHSRKKKADLIIKVIEETRKELPFHRADSFAHITYFRLKDRKLV